MMSAPESGKEDEDFDVMQWWRAKSTKYPILSNIELRILSIPASSAASERVFSLAGNILFPNSFYKTVSS